MAENSNQNFHKASSNSDVQEIKPPICVRSTHKKCRRRLLREPLDRCFCRCSPRNKKSDEDATNNSEFTPLQDTTVHQNHNLVKDSNSRKISYLSLPIITTPAVQFWSECLLEPVHVCGCYSTENYRSISITDDNRITWGIPFPFLFSMVNKIPKTYASQIYIPCVLQVTVPSQVVDVSNKTPTARITTGTTWSTYSLLTSSLKDDP
jgi:hypothetical protein